MKFQHLTVTIILGAVVASPLVQGAEQIARINVDPYCTRQISGQSELARERYFSLGDPGAGFDRRCKDKEMYDYLVHELGIHFGRSLGPIAGVVKWSSAVTEDPERAGFADVDRLTRKMASRVKEPSATMRRDFGVNLGVAAHGNHNAYPEFMGRYGQEEALKGDHPEYLPQNLDAAVELAVTIFTHGYSAFDRPAFYEPLNEPHWSYYGDPHLAEWHLKLLEAFHRDVPGTQVGGLCLSVAYMYDHDYRTWNGFRKFLDLTQGRLDFYSFHAYDYLDFVDGEFAGRVQSGLPMEGVLDLIPNYTVNHYGKEVPLVISEQGGYVTGEQGQTSDQIAQRIATEKFPGKGFAWELKKRSIMEFNHISSIVANTLNFMDHPHTVQKAVPFILLQSFDWDPTYYSTLYTMHDFQDRSRWVPTCNLDFYRFFRDLKGRRVKGICPDPDIQIRAFVDGSTLRVVLNNLWTEPKPLSLDLPGSPRISVRRLGRNEDFTPFLVEGPVASLEGLSLAGRETLLVTAEYTQTLPESHVVNEVICYGDRTVISLPADKAATFNIAVPPGEQTDYAQLRVGFRRPSGTRRLLLVQVNGHPVDMPPEPSASRYEIEADYATTRFAYIDPAWIRDDNTITVSFPDGAEATIGSVVLRVAKKPAR